MSKFIWITNLIKIYLYIKIYHCLNESYLYSNNIVFNTRFGNYYYNKEYYLEKLENINKIISRLEEYPIRNEIDVLSIITNYGVSATFDEVDVMLSKKTRKQKIEEL